LHGMFFSATIANVKKMQVPWLFYRRSTCGVCCIGDPVAA